MKHDRIKDLRLEGSLRDQRVNLIGAWRRSVGEIARAIDDAHISANQESKLFVRTFLETVSTVNRLYHGLYRDVLPTVDADTTNDSDAVKAVNAALQFGHTQKLFSLMERVATASVPEYLQGRKAKKNYARRSLREAMLRNDEFIDGYAELVTYLSDAANSCGGLSESEAGHINRSFRESIRTRREGLGLGSSE